MATKNVSTDRQKALEAALAQISKKFGEGSAMRLGDRPHIDVKAFSTGSLLLDAATGIGGFPCGRVSEIYAQESVGKTTVVLHAIADCQRRGGVAAFIDAEHALDPAYAKRLGVDIDALIISQPDAGEDALEIADTLISSGAVDFIAIDSVAALVPRAELDGEMEDMQVGLQARLMSKALRKLTGSVSRTNTCLVFINQLREKIGGMGYGDNSVTTGGKALKYYASVRIKMARTGSRLDGKEKISNKIKAKVDKNKFAPPFKEAEFEIMFGEGISREAQILVLGEEKKMIRKGGAYLYYKEDGGNEIALGMGFANAIQFLKDNKELSDSLWDRLVELYKTVHVGYGDELDPTVSDADPEVEVKETKAKK